jgi:hypothetical protein
MHSISGARRNASGAAWSTPCKTTNQEANDNARFLHWRTRRLTSTLALSAKGDSVHVKIFDAATARPIANTEMELYSDNGIR